MSAEAESLIRSSLEALDFERICREYRDQDEFVFIPRLIPEQAARLMIEESRRFSKRDIHRTYMPTVRKGGAVSHAGIAERAPFLHALYRSPSLLAFAARLAGEPLAIKHETDAHAAALYYYQRPGDHVTYHYDDCGCEGASYTAIFGVVNRTEASKLHVQLYRGEKGREMKDLYISTEPGDFVFFRGNNAYHRVTPLGRGEERITYSFAYVKEGRHARGYQKLQTTVKDAFLYFGLKAFFQNKKAP